MLITLSGMDGAGKTTASQFLGAKLHSRGAKVRQFSFSESRMWALLQLVQKKLGGDLKQIAPSGIGLPLNLDRLGFLIDYVSPALEQYDFVILQRFVLDWVAVGRIYNDDDLPIAKAIRRLFHGPVTQVYLKITADDALRRIRERGFDGEHRESPAALTELEEAYNSAVHQLDGPFEIIDGTKSREHVQMELQNLVDRITASRTLAATS